MKYSVGKRSSPQSFQRMMWAWVVIGFVVALLTLMLTVQQPIEVQHTTLTSSSSGEVAKELHELRTLLEQQKAASRRQGELLKQLMAIESQDQPRGGAGPPSVTSTPLESHTLADSLASPRSAAATAAMAAKAATALEVATAERKALGLCSESDVPILALLRRPCPDGMHGYGCTERWGLSDRYLPDPHRWLTEWNASARAVVHCQRGFFDALADRYTRAHWEVEWDAQPFRIAATPPRTIGKMLHQIVTANYYHLTLPPGIRPPLRHAPLPGWSYAKTTQPGFRWNVLDYGIGNVFSDPCVHTRGMHTHSRLSCAGSPADACSCTQACMQLARRAT